MLYPLSYGREAIVLGPAARPVNGPKPVDLINQAQEPLPDQATDQDHLAVAIEAAGKVGNTKTRGCEGKTHRFGCMRREIEGAAEELDLNRLVVDDLARHDRGTGAHDAVKRKCFERHQLMKLTAQQRTSGGHERQVRPKSLI